MECINVETMYATFENCEKFKSDLSERDVSNVINMISTFFNYQNFNSNLSKGCF